MAGFRNDLLFIVRLSIRLGRSVGWNVGLSGALLRLGQVEHPEKLLREHKVLGAEDLIGARIVQVGEDDLGIREQLAVQECLAGDDGPLATQIR